MANLLTNDQVAERLGIKPATLEQWRIYGRSPAFIKVGRNVRYDERDVEAWINANRVTSTSDAVPAAA